MKRTAKLSAVSSALAIAAALAFSGQAQADQVDAKLESLSPAVNTTGQVKVEVGTLVGGGSINATESAGVGTFTQNSGPLLTFGANQFVAFCIDLTDTIGIGSTHTWDVVDLAAAPDTTSGPMGVAKADALAKLFGSNLGTSLNDGVATYLTDATKQAAMQIAVWEIVFETSGQPFDVASGNAQFSNNALVTAQAQDYLDNIGLIGNRMGGLVGLTSGSTQDFVAQVPIPAAAWLFGSALVGAVGLGRRRKNKGEAATA